MATPAELLAQSLAKFQTANRIDGTKASYRKDNPIEYGKVIAYLTGGSRPSGVTSDMGMGLMLEEDARRALEVIEPPPPQGAYFDDTFNDPNFALWLKTPSGAVPSLINLVPNGEGGNCVRLITTPTSSGPNPSSEMTSLWQGWNDPDIHTGRGEETWYRIRTRFPSGQYFPTTGEWNWHFAWHNNDHTASYGPNTYSTEMGVCTDFPVVSGQIGQNPRLWVQMMGGNSASPTVKYVRMPSNSLKWDHWYDIVFKFLWGTRQDGNGWFGWWVDGQAIVNESFPVLYDNPDGSHDTPGFGLYNYHLHDPAHTSELHFDRVLIGPSAASVGFTP